MKTIQILAGILMIGMMGCGSPSDDPYAVCAEFDALDARILELIDQVKQEHANDRIFLKAFNMEQVYWIQYRNRRIRSLYPKDWNTHYRKKYGKDVFNPCKCKELVRLSEKRIEDLEMYVKGGPRDQRDCPSMLN